MLAGKLVGAFEQGGIVGGASYSGDNLIARVNSGEMILNETQQSELWALVNGASSPTRNVGATINQAIKYNVFRRQLNTRNYRRVA